MSDITEYTAVAATDPGVVQDVAEAGINVSSSLLQVDKAPGAAPVPGPEIA